MAVKVKCPWCRALVEMGGDREICPKCGHEVTLARAAQMDPLPPPPAKEVSPFPHEREGLKLTISFILLALLACIILVRISTMPHRRYKTNEVVAMATLRTIQRAQEGYRQRWGHYVTLDLLREADAIDVRFKGENNVYRRVPDPCTGSYSGKFSLTDGDGVITEGSRSGYDFTFRISGDKWNASAVPLEPGNSGRRSFYIDETGVVRYAPCESAGDPPTDENSKPVTQ
jgi:type II secretory pathway pseudopilin PulG